MVPRIFLSLISVPMYYSLLTRRAITPRAAERSDALHSAAERRRRLTICFNLPKQGALS
jgi:hypothetical protein